MSDDRLSIVFIAGDSRSGSTLLDLTLGQAEGLFSAGELRYLWERGLVHNELCGCGAGFSDCPLWREVMQRAFGELNADAAEQILQLQRQVDHPRSVFRNAFFSPRRFTPAFKRLRGQYQQHLIKLYRGIRETTGCRWIIDSSKAPSHGMLLAGLPEVRLHVIHLVRDARAVAWSMQRRKRRPEAGVINDAGDVSKIANDSGGGGAMPDYLPSYPPWRTAVRWSLTNRACRWFGRTGGGYSLVRYEDFIDQPGRIISFLLKAIGELDATASFVKDKRVTLSANHTAAGNPMRFHAGALELAADEDWRQNLPKVHQQQVAWLARGGLHRYGYL